MQIVFGYMFTFNITDIQSVYTERSTGCQITTPFSIYFFLVFTDNVTLTHLLLLLESLLSVISSFVFSFLLLTLKKSVIWCMVSF
jgi:hypothetical protein